MQMFMDFINLNEYSDAVIDSSGRYRYSLRRKWNSNLSTVLFVMLNPSTADHNVNDPTIRRCTNFAKNWGFGSLQVVNLFAYRATDPKELQLYTYPIGEENDYYIEQAVLNAGQIVLAWGTRGGFQNRDYEVLQLLKKLSRAELYCLDLTKEGHPKHPLYVRQDVRLTRYSFN